MAALFLVYPRMLMGCDFAYRPITSTSPASEFVGIDQAVTYGTDGASILALTAGIVDTGTTLTLLATGRWPPHAIWNRP